MSEKPNSKVFVGRLPEGCTAKDMEDLFSTYGTVNQCDIIGKYGFVHMNKVEEAEEAIKKLNNYNFMGSQLTVQFSTSKKKEGSGKVRKPMAANRQKRGSGPFRNNSFGASRGPPFESYGPPPAPPSRFGPYYDNGNQYYRDPYNRESDPYFRDSGDNMRSTAYEPQLYGRRPPPQTAPNYSRGPARDFYDRGDAQYSRPLSNPGFNPSMPPPETRGIAFGGPSRNGYGPVGYPNRGPAGGHRPPPPPTARWQPY